MSPVGSDYTRRQEEPVVELGGVGREHAILLRRGPNLKALSLGALSQGEKVAVLGRTKATVAAGGVKAPWYKIRTGPGVAGWVHGFGIDVDKYALEVMIVRADVDPRELAAAIQAHDLDRVQALLEAGVDVNCCEPQCRAAVDSAVLPGNEAILKLLLAAGMDPHACDRLDGSTLLMRAVTLGHSEAVRLLLDAGADVDEPNMYGDTALVEAAAEGNLDMVRLLLDAGATPNLGFPATALEASHGNAEVARLLREATAKRANETTP
jgi:hypothetical protein